MWKGVAYVRKKIRVYREERNLQKGTECASHWIAGVERACILAIWGLWVHTLARLRVLMKNSCSQKENMNVWQEEIQKVISSLIRFRQSFKPGEITPEEANQVGYETAMRFTKGNHAFIVATHTDKAHIHNHIIFNSTSLDCTHKFRDFFFVGLALQRLSDIICLEHGLSVIEKKKPSDRVKRTTYPEKKSFRDDIREAIDRILKEGSEKILMSCFINWKMPDTRLSVESIFL